MVYLPPAYQCNQSEQNAVCVNFSSYVAILRVYLYHFIIAHILLYFLFYFFHCSLSQLNLFVYFHYHLEFSFPLFAFSIYCVFFCCECLCVCYCIIQFSFVYLTKYCAHSNIFTHTRTHEPFLIVEWSVKFQYFVVVIASFKIHYLTFWP